MKAIQDALLYNKIECYNKGVQRSPSRLVKGCTHSLKYLHHSRSKMFGRAPKKGSSFPPLDHISVETTECWLHHDARCKHWRSSSLTENNVFLEVEMQRNILIPPDQLVWTVIPRLMSISTTRKSSNKHEFFVDVTSGGKISEWRIWDLTGDILFPVAFKDTIPTTIPIVTVTNPGHC